MARYIEQLNECTIPASGDWLWIVDTSAAAGDKDRRVNAGLVPWTNTLTTFTRQVNASPDGADDAAFNAIIPAGATERVLRWQYDGALRGYIQSDPSTNQLALMAFDNGTGVGCSISLQRNNNASTPAAGLIYMQTRGAAQPSRRLWVDDTGLLRIHTADPTSANDTAGTVVGAQSSSLDAKEIIGPSPSPAEALCFVAKGAEAVRAFRYKSGACNGEEFSGLVTDFAPRYGMDRDEEHPAGKSLNLINAIGDLMVAVDYLAGKVAELEARHA